jgi:hypothetical protein
MKQKQERESLSCVDLIENGLHTNAAAYSAAKTLLDVHGTLNSIRNVAQNHVDESGNPYDVRIGCGLIVEWMEEVLEKIEKVHNEHLNINHYKNK